MTGVQTCALPICTITNTTRSGPSAEWLVGWLDGLKNVGRGTRSRPPGLLARLSPDPFKPQQEGGQGGEGDEQGGSGLVPASGA